MKKQFTVILFNILSFSTLVAQDLVDIVVPEFAESIPINGQATVYYELKIEKNSSDSIVLTRLEILNKKFDSVLVSFEREALSRMIRMTDNNSGIIYIEYHPQKKYSDIYHRLGYMVIEKTTKRRKKTIFKTHVVGDTSAEYELSIEPQNLNFSPPFREGTWTAVYEPSWERGHRRVPYTVAGAQRIPGRYAIDFIKVNDDGKLSNHNSDSVKNWFGYGVDVLAVADGIVVAVINDFPESQTLSAHPAYPSDKATGNYVALKVDGDTFVFYEHLKPGSIRVVPGQKVKSGEVIASLGFTGQTTGPHLHLHVSDKNSPLGAEGIPFAFKNFDVLGRYHDMSTFGKTKWEQHNGVGNSFVNERPAPNTVIIFK